MRPRIGIFGGAFNPPHIGHLILAEEAAHDLELDSVLMVPTGRAGHKLLESDPGGDLRIEMVEAAVAPSRALSVERFEVQAATADSGPSLMHVTLEAMHEREPEADLVLILGADAAGRLGTWRQPERVLELATVAIADRLGTDVGAGEAELRRLGAGRWELVRMPQIDVSSSAIRERVAVGEPYRFLVGPDVAEVIEARGLYR